MIPLSVPHLAGNEWKYVRECLDTNWVSSAGSFVTRFGEELAEYVGVKHAVAVNTGSAGLHLALLACGVQEGDEVIVPTLTFIATINVVRYCGAHPVFMDADPETFCLDEKKLKRFLEEECEEREGQFVNKTSGRVVRVVMPVHVFGHPSAMGDIMTTARAHGVKVVEDATESLGSTLHGRKTGTFADASVFSFNGNKIMTSGGGGAVVTDSDDVHARVKHLANQANTDVFIYDHDDVGFNYRLTNVQAAIGAAQLEQLDGFIEKKRRNAALYAELLASVHQVEFAVEREGVRSNCWFYTILVSTQHRDALMAHLVEKKIQVRPIWKLMHEMDMFSVCQQYELTEAPRIQSMGINLPCSTSLTEDEVHFVVNAIKEYFSHV